MDFNRTHEVHLRLSKEVENLEKEFDADQQNALQELQQAQNEIENKAREDRSMLEKGLGSIPSDFGHFIEEKRDFYLRQATQKYEERMGTSRKRFLDMLAAVNEKWRSLPFDMDDTVGVYFAFHRVHSYFLTWTDRTMLANSACAAVEWYTDTWNGHGHALFYAVPSASCAACT